jgi:SNF2 family DNA or RNA helicase
MHVQVKWLRVVLDEGHFIRNASTKQSKACADIPARALWVVTGTPIQNAMKDLFGLLAFLRLSPLCERTVFNASFVRPIALGDTAGLLRLRVLLSQIALRRLKTTKVRDPSHMDAELHNQIILCNLYVIRLLEKRPGLHFFRSARVTYIVYSSVLS